MSRRLVLIRHAEAQDAHPGGDHERELTDHGAAAAVALGSWLGGQGLAPDLVLVSTAVRTRQTSALALEGAGAADRPEWPGRTIYDGGFDGVAGEISTAPDDAQVLWVVGHHPVMPSVALALLEGEAPELERGFPTATAAVLELDADWDSLAPGRARLVAVHTARP